ncbi:MAG: tRNA threonylcarbamoyladenosine dehydratase [Chromatiaceae bacterium]|nr:MAG: tRNA threonylcarbamoyladenosine dehydratase [Chromatiaceae bacterium]
MTDTEEALWARTGILVGATGIARLQRARVLLVGLGGVGGHAAEALARAGVGSLTIVDGDLVAPSNLNRQLAALHSTVGRPKTAVIQARIADINPHCAVDARTGFLAAEDMPALVADGFDQIVDAIDSVNSKVALLAAALAAGIPVASSMGAGGRLDPGCLQTGDLMDSAGCPLARVIRARLRRRGHGRGVLAVWSDEPPRPPLAPQPSGRGRPRAVNGTISYLPGLFGLTLAGLVIQRILASPPSVT